MNPSLLIFGVVAFLAVLLAMEGVYNLWASKSSPQAKRLAARLDALSGETAAAASIVRVEEELRLASVNTLLVRFAIGRRLKSIVSAAGIGMSPAELVGVSLLLGAVGAFLPGAFEKPPIFGAVFGLGLALLPWWWVSGRRNKRIGRMERQFPEALDLMGRAMRAGHALPSAIKMVADELPQPLGGDFRLLFDEINYGVPTNDALMHLADRIPVADVSYFAVAVMIQRESGGNLAELLDSIAKIVRERLRLLGEIRTLSAEGKLSAIILTALPFGVALVVNLVNPTFMSVLFSDPLGMRMLGAVMLMMMLGILWMRSIIRIRV